MKAGDASPSSGIVSNTAAAVESDDDSSSRLAMTRPNSTSTTTGTGRPSRTTTNGCNVMMSTRTRDNENNNAVLEEMVQELETGYSLSEQAHNENVVCENNNNNTKSNNSANNNNNNTVYAPGSTTVVQEKFHYSSSSVAAAKFSSMEELRQHVYQDMMTTIGVQSPFDDSSITATSNNSKQQVLLPLVYCDFTASHRPLKSLEAYVQTKCLPYYGNTHTNMTHTSSQSTAFCAEARQMIGEFANAHITGKASQDVVLFAGNGTTCAVQLLIDCLGLKHYQCPQQPEDGATNNSNKKPLILVGPMEHHSNLLPWRELGSDKFDIVQIHYKDGNLDIDHLRNVLKQESSSRPFIIGTFAAVSNLTGSLADDLTITATLHEYGALSVWDYATAASYMAPNMNPTSDNKLYAKDAVIWSGHKLLGASSSTPGVLIIKKHLVSQINSPSLAGGGTVFYVSQDSHRFLSNRMERWEGGTPNIVGIWKLGLAVKFKRDMKQITNQLLLLPSSSSSSSSRDDNSQHCHQNKNDLLLELEMKRAQEFQSRLKQIPNLILLDDDSTISNDNNTTTTTIKYKKVPIFSFLIKCGSRFLHYNYVCALLNDIFGIQSRGGCQCAGPFGQYLLGISRQNNQAIEQCLIHTKDELLRPGLTRLSLPALGTTTAIDNYVIQALTWISQHGWKFLHVYRVHPRAGEWRHKSRQKLSTPLGKQERQWLSHYNNLLDNNNNINNNNNSNVIVGQDNSNNREKAILSLDQAMNNANRLLEIVLKDQASISQALKMKEHYHDDDHQDDVSNEMNDAPAATVSSASLRWYVHPKDVAEYISANQDVVPGTMDRSNVLGPIRPIAWYGPPALPTNAARANSAGAVSSSSSVPSSSLPKEEGQVATNHEGKNKDSGTLLMFRDRETHSGEASIEDIQRGYDDGDLSDKCQIYNVNDDSWMEISSYLAQGGEGPARLTTTSLTTDSTTMSTAVEAPKEQPTAVTPKSSPTPPMKTQEAEGTGNDDVVGLVSFRDGTHSGKASWEEIEVGFEDGELSAQCEFFDTSKDAWRLLRDAIGEKRSPAVDAGVDDDDDDAVVVDAAASVALAMAGTTSTTTTTTTTYDFQLVEKNEKKKPARDSSTWGRGSMVVLENKTLPSLELANTLTDAERIASDQPEQQQSKKRKRHKHIKPPGKLMRLVTQAMIQWDMLEDGDRLLLGLSGGKDSLSLLHILLEFQKKLPIKFDIEVCTVDPMTPSFDPSPLIPYVESLGLKYHFIRDDIVDRANKSGKDGAVVSSLCSYCARMKRGNLYTCARKNNCNKLVLAQHLDDLAESFMMSVMHNGFLRTMKANYKINAGDLSVIRPLVYCRESLTTDFAKSAKLPIINENCPACFEEPKERARVKKLLSREETLYPNFYDNIKRSLLPLMHDDATAILRSYTEEALAKSRKEQGKKRRPNREVAKGGGKNEKVAANDEGEGAAQCQAGRLETIVVGGNSAGTRGTMLAEASEEELVRELARRRAERFRLAGAMKRLGEQEDDPTGQVCTLNGGDGSIPCRELME